MSSEYSGHAYSWYFGMYMALVRRPLQRSYIKKLLLHCDLIDQLPIVADTLDMLGSQAETLDLSFDLHLQAGDMDYFHERLSRMPAFGNLRTLKLNTSFDDWHPTATIVLDKCQDLASLSLCGKDTSRSRPRAVAPPIWPTLANVTDLEVSVDPSNLASLLALGERCPLMKKLSVTFKEGFYVSFPVPGARSAPSFQKLQDLTVQILNARCNEAVDYVLAKVSHSTIDSVHLKCPRPVRPSILKIGVLLISL